MSIVYLGGSEFNGFVFVCLGSEGLKVWRGAKVLGSRGVYVGLSGTDQSEPDMFLGMVL